jgi:hypothetical protein
LRSTGSAAARIRLVDLQAKQKDWTNDRL